MIALCIAVAGAIQAVVPTTAFTLAWTHSIEKVRWEETYRVSADRLELREARIKGSAAGMEPPPDAVLENGWWKYHPAIQPLERLRLANSDFAEDYTLCWGAACRRLAEIIGPAPSRTFTELFPCDRPVLQ